MRVTIRKSKRNPDFWEVCVNGKVKSRHLKKVRANQQAAALRRIAKKRKARRKAKK
jgi:hypothetical protein